MVECNTKFSIKRLASVILLSFFDSVLIFSRSALIEVARSSVKLQRPSIEKSQLTPARHALPVSECIMLEQVTSLY